MPNNETRGSGGRTNPSPRPVTPSSSPSGRTVNGSSGARSNPSPRGGSSSSGTSSKGK